MLDIQKINHNYIIRMVVFSAFLYKSNIKDKNLYKLKIQEFILKKLHNIELSIYFPIEISKEDSRDIILDKILYDTENPNISDLVVFKFKTSIKEVNLQIDLGNQEKYDLFLYG
jgi:hypothetical protein